MLTPGIVDQFGQFCEKSRVLLAHEAPAPAAPNLPVAQFIAFAGRAGLLATAQARCYLARLAPKAALLKPWIVRHDLLDVAGFAYAESAYTSLIAWALFPAGQPDIALRVQAAWVSSFAPGVKIRKAAEPHDQFFTDGGIPDLVIDYPERLVIVEAKTKSTEHVTPGGQMQTFAYPGETLKALGYEADRPHSMIYLTPHRANPANPAAVPMSYVEVALAIAAGLAGAELAPDLKAAYAMLITHLITRAVPHHTDLLPVLTSASDWLGDTTAKGNQRVLEALDAIQSVTALLPLEEAQ